MAAATTSVTLVSPDRPQLAVGIRAFLVLATLGAVAGASLVPSGQDAMSDPDLVRVIRAMAAIKGGLAALAFAACLLRLTRPAASWRTAAYVIGPPLMAAGAVALWRLDHLGAAAIALHVALGAVIVAALTDDDFVILPARRGRTGRS